MGGTARHAPRTPPPGGWSTLPLADGFYAGMPNVCPPGLAVLDTPLVKRLPRKLLVRVMENTVGRGFLLFLASTRHPAVVVELGHPGWRTLLALRALLGRRRKLIIFQFIVHPQRRHPLRRLIEAADRWAVRRALLRGGALTRADQRALAARYGRPIADFAFVPWPRSFDLPDQLPPAASEPLVLSAGRSYCDWPAVFAAAAGRDWPLEVVCRRQDADKVAALNAGGLAKVHVELPLEEYRALLARATVSLVAMYDGETSHGHLRLMDAAAAGVPVVATATPSIAEYVQDGRTVDLVPEGDAAAIGEAVDRLLADAGRREVLRRAAFEQAAGWTSAQYLAALRVVVDGREPELPAAAPH